MTCLLRRSLVRNFTIDTFATIGQWDEIDTPDDFALYERMVRDGELALEG